MLKKRPPPATSAEASSSDPQLQILTALQALSDRTDRFETHHASSSSSLPLGQDYVPPPRLQCPAEEDATDDADVLFLYAPHSLSDGAHHSEGGTHSGDPHSDTAEVDEESAGVWECATNPLVSTQQKLLVCSTPCLTQSQCEVSGRAYLRLIPHLVFH